jgi:hypothetical protein
MASLFNLLPYNSTSYVDVVALQLGLQRLPSETADTFLDRLYAAANNTRDHSFQGTVDQLAFELGLTVSVGVNITCYDPTVLIQVSFAQISITQGSNTIVIPFLTIAPDNYWTWRMLSDVVADINSKTPCEATLLCEDGLAWQLANQSSLNIAVAKNVTAQQVQLDHSGIIVGSERFNATVPAYTLSSAGLLVFSSNPPANTQITYVYNLSPFQLAVSQVGAFSFMDPSLPTYAAGPNGGLVHQLQEYIQAIMSVDQSYWGQ